MRQDFLVGTLGQTGLKVGRLGVAASYGAPTKAFEEAFERGCNYFYIGSGRHRANMARAIRNICDAGYREKLVVAVQTYARLGLATEKLLLRSLRNLRIGYADVIVAGWHNRPPTAALIDRMKSWQEKGICRFLAMSGHNRQLFPRLAEKDLFDIFHIRYNAAHRGAESECFPFLTREARIGIVTYTATRWGHLLKQKHMPDNEAPLSAADCYRFSLSNPAVDVCLCGPADMDQMRQALSALEAGPLSEAEMARVKKIGDHVHQHAGGFFG
jgi:predicted aldo/keto reductase-like oxidoreductase